MEPAMNFREHEVTDINENPDRSSAVLKLITVLCAVGAVVLPWVNVPLGVVAILLSVMCIILSIVAMCQKGVVFGIIMMIVGFIVGGVATFGLCYTALGLGDLEGIQLEYSQKILAAQTAGDTEQVEKLTMEMQVATLDKFMSNFIALAEKYGTPHQVQKLKQMQEETRNEIEPAYSPTPAPLPAFPDEKGEEEPPAEDSEPTEEALPDGAELAPGDIPPWIKD